MACYRSAARGRPPSTHVRLLAGLGLLTSPHHRAGRDRHATLTMAKELAAGLQAVRGAMEKLGPEINALNFEEIENGYIDARGRQ